MISLEKSGLLLGDLGKKMSDEEILKVRSDLYELAKMALDNYFSSKNETLDNP